jgi:hypothetical protein
VSVFETFVRSIDDLHEGEQTVLVLRDLSPGRRKYFAQHVRGVVRRGPDSGEARPLRVRSMVGNVIPGDWYVTVSELLPARVPGTPYTNAFDALQAAWGHET